MNNQYLNINGSWTNTISIYPREVVRVQTELPVLGVIEFNGFSTQEIKDGIISDVTELDIYFRYSVDAIHFSDYYELAGSELLGIKGIRPSHPVIIEYSIENHTTRPINLLYINLEFDASPLPVIENYERTHLSEDITFYNRDSLLWSVNMLNKIFKNGIVPKYIRRSYNKNWGDKDFIDFWWCIIYLSSFKIYYTELFTEILYRKDLLTEYLKQRGIYLSKADDIGELYYLANHYYNEMRRRGTYMIMESRYELPDNYHNIHVKGELLRMFNISNISDIEIFHLSGDDCGWFLDMNSPEYSSPTSIKGYIKKDIDGFYTLKSQISYEITFMIKISPFGNLTFGVEVYDEYMNPVKNLYKINEVEGTNYFFINENIIMQNEWYFVRGIIYQYGTHEDIDPTLNIGVGNQLTFSQKGLRKIKPVIEWNGVDVIETNVMGLSVRPAIDLISGYLDQAEQMIIMNENVNREFNNDNIQNIIDKYLVDYNITSNYIAV